MGHELQLEMRRVEDCDYVEASRRLSLLCLEIRRRGATAPLLLQKAYLEIDARNFAQATEAAEAAFTKDPTLLEAQLVWGRALFYGALVRAGIMEGASGTGIGNPGPQILAAYRHVSDYVAAVPSDEDAERLCTYLDKLVIGNHDSSRMLRQLRRDFSPTSSQG
jgi:uncharacterized membrane-anchored protein